VSEPAAGVPPSRPAAVRAGARNPEQADPQTAGVLVGLQQSLLPADLPVLPRARIAARYLPAGPAGTAAGDWFDAVPLPGGTVALMVGDVVGRGARALTAMAQLRAVLTELLTAETSLVKALLRADSFAARSAALRAATLALAVLDPVTGRVRYAVCGHPPPLVVSPQGQARYLNRARTGPLGIGSAPALASDQLRPGELVLLYSDGLIKRPGRPLGESMDALAEVASKIAVGPTLPDLSPAVPAERLCQLTAELCADPATADDVTMLAAEILVAPVPPVRLRVPSAAASVSVARRALTDWLGAVDPRSDDRDAVHMAVVEVMTNAIEHAYPAGQPGPIDVSLALRPDGQLECTITDYGRWRPPDPAAPGRGNGLMVAKHLIDQLQISHPAEADDAPEGAAGTVVTLLHRLTRAAVISAEAGDAASAMPARQALEITAETGSQSARAWVTGPIDISTADEFLRRMLSACRGGTLSMTVDLDAVTNLASAGVSALYQLSRQLQLHERGLRLVAGPDSPAHAVLELVSLPHATSDGSPAERTGGGELARQPDPA
jgi:anti-sigma regulatory factor (Ser/Thr protein kinase)/anti-anti-sigma regulatory factor